MQTIIVVILVVLILLLVLTFPITLKVFFYSNVLENSNFLCIKILFFYFCKKINVQNGSIILTSTNGNEKKIEIKMLSKFQNAFFKEVFGEIGIDDFYSVFNFGVCDDAFKTAFICGILHSVFSQMKVFLNSKKNVIIYYKIYTNYTNDKLSLTLNTKIYFSILGIVFALVKAFFKTKGESNGEKRKSNQWNFSKHTR